MLRLRQLTTLSVKRNQGNYDPVTRKWIEGSGNAPFSLECSFQPIKGKHLKMVPEGFTSTDIRLIHCSDPLLAENEDIGQEADIIVYDGFDYKVLNVEHWSELRLAHYEVLIGKVEKA